LVILWIPSTMQRDCMYKRTKDQQFIKSLDFITNIKYFILNISNIWNQIFQIFQNKYQIFHIKYFKYLISNIKPPDFITMPSSLFLYVWFSFRLFCHIPLHHHIISSIIVSYHNTMKMLGTLYKFLIYVSEQCWFSRNLCENMFDMTSLKTCPALKSSCGKDPCLDNWCIYQGIFTGLSVVYKLWKDCNFLKLELL